MTYDIYINDQLYRTVTGDGYNYVNLVNEITQAKDNGELGDFNIESGLAIRIEKR